MQPLITLAARIINRLPVVCFQFAPVPVMHESIRLMRIKNAQASLRYYR